MTAEPPPSPHGSDWQPAGVARRGLPVDPGEVEVMARIVPPGFVIMPAVALGWTILVYLRTRGRLAS